ncbi:hypothetical protein [Myxacorys almedinensis]|uniref:Uncharacterized protein n=1 Tax=Myxacorys almedinensis A TaxID=2690445 RepID=A0A8J7Z2T9_9CYAN|nr:hypothetical protein [Myxacorys almedinensis]NDJ18997.1 hypothetical protein [Myxacorys almedinensis A]
MANTNVFRGSDATLTLAIDDQPEGQAAQEIIEFYQLSPVGRATSVEVYVQTDLELFHEIGKRHPAALRPGNINIFGKVGRAYINGALLRLLLGKGALVAREQEPYPQPSFNLLLDLKDPAVPDTSSTLTIHGVKFENWAYSLPEDDFVMESVTFKGLFITVEDKEAA